jgi:hypothetical protein
MPLYGADRDRELDNDQRKKKGSEADAAAASEINQGDLAAAARKAKGLQGSQAGQPTGSGEPTAPGLGASLGEIAAYNKRRREYMATQNASAGSQKRALQ